MKKWMEGQYNVFLIDEDKELQLQWEASGVMQGGGRCWCVREEFRGEKIIVTQYEKDVITKDRDELFMAA